MLKKTFIWLVAAMFGLTTLAAAQPAADTPLMGKITAMEKMIYGEERTGSLVDRVTAIEKDMYGYEEKDALLEKVDRLYNNLFVTDGGEAALQTRLSAVEWAITQRITEGSMKNRIETMEKMMDGNPLTGPFKERLDNLANLAFKDGQIHMAETAIPPDTLIKIKILTPLSSKDSRVGDEVQFQVAEDVILNGVLVIAKGAQGAGRVGKVTPARNFGRDGQLEVDFHSIMAIDGAKLDTVLGEKAKEESKTMFYAAGASMAGLVLLGPVGVVGGIFVNGKDAEIPAGTLLFIQTKGESQVYGLETGTGSE